MRESADSLKTTTSFGSLFINSLFEEFIDVRHREYEDDEDRPTGVLHQTSSIT